MNAAFEDILNAKFLCDLAHVDRPIFLSEGSVARDDKQAADARQIADQIIGQTIRKVIRVPIVGIIEEGEDDDRRSVIDASILVICVNRLWGFPFPFLLDRLSQSARFGIRLHAEFPFQKPFQ